MGKVAVLFAVVLVVLPFTGCGGGGGDPATGCVASCGLCFVNTPCCGEGFCTLSTSDGVPRCEASGVTCKLAP
jgi:hypothetical protein